MVLFDFIDSYLFPSVCHVCGRQLVAGEDRVCLHCLDALPRTDFLNRSDNPLLQRYSRQPNIVSATALLHYGNDTRLLVHDLKYHNFPQLGNTLGTLMADEGLQHGIFSGVDLLVPVPLHWLRRLSRGYNQSLKLCEGISQRTGTEISTENLVRTRNNRSQTALSHTDRQKNKQGLFRLKHPEMWNGKHIMIIDDVFTTGATIEACIHAISQQTSDTKISIYTLAYAGV